MEKKNKSAIYITMVVVVVVAIVVFFLVKGNAGNEPERRKLPSMDVFKDSAFSADCIGGGTFGFNDIASTKLTVVNIWATYCGPCIEEMPTLGKISNERKGQVQIVGMVSDIVDMDGNVMDSMVAEAVSIIEKTGASYKHIIPSKELTKILFDKIDAVPTTWFIDSEGNVLGTVVGGQSEEAWNQLIDEYLEKVK